MKKRKNHSPEFKAKVALEAIREELTLAELSKKYGVQPNMISGWKRTAIENMASGFFRGKSVDARASEAEIEKLHSKIGQLVVERDFLAEASRLLVCAIASLLERVARDAQIIFSAKNGEP